VASWAGWKRSLAAGRLPGGRPCSIYQARPWASAVLPLFDTAGIRLDFDVGVLERLRAVVGRLERAKVELAPPPGHSAPLRWTDEWRRKPMPHQVQAIRALEHLYFRAILADDMGLGKTASAIWAWQQSGVKRCLIVCPKTVKRNWIREIDATIGYVQPFLIDGTTKQRADVFGFLRHYLKHGDGGEDRKAAVINYDLLHRLPDPEKRTLVEWIQDQFLILDESHYCKNRKAARTQFIMDELAPSVGGAACRLCLSGTPVRNTLEDLWAQLHIVRPGIYSSFAQFDKFHLVRGRVEYEYARAADGKVKKRVQSVVRAITAKEQLNAIVNTVQVRRKKEDVLDLPEKVFTYPDFDLDSHCAKVYAMMRDFALVELAELPQDMNVFAPGARSALEATLRLEQIAQGFLGGIPEQYLERVTPLISKHAEKVPGRPGHVIFPKAAKIEWLQETIETILLQGGKPLVFSRFNTPMFWLAEQWADSAVMHGQTSLENRDKILADFASGGVQVLFCQVKIAEGWNAVCSRDVIFFGRDWSPAINAQAVDRVHRIGQKGTVQVQIPIVAGTFEGYLHRKLAAKQKDADVALRSLSIRELREALA
jgi:SNF2 family DNA or RNA helicase